MESKEEKDKREKIMEEKKYSSKTGGSKKSPGELKKIIIENPAPDIYPPCIKLLMQGIKQDGRKRALLS